LRPGASIRVVAAINGHRSGREVTRALVERAACGEPAARLRSQVAAWRPGATGEQVEEAVQQACLLAARSCRGQSEREVFAWLRTTARRELARSQQRARRELPVDPHVLSLLPGAGVAAAPEQQLIDDQDDLEVERVAHAVLGRLSERQREIIALHVRGRGRPQLAAHLGMTPRSVKRQLERIMSVGRAELVRLAGHGCPAGEPLVARLAFGLANPREVGEAQLHLATCPRCGVLYERLDLWREKVATLLPIPAVEQARPGLAEWALHRVGEGLASLKQHATAGYSRALDPTPLAGVRPGAAAAAITGCLALGSGTTYCVTQSVDPIGGLAQIVIPTRETKQAPRREKRVAPRQATSTPSSAPTAVATPTAEPTRSSPQPAAQVTSQPTPEPTPPPTPEVEFEPLAPATSVSTAPRRSSVRREATPAPAPAGGPGEFDGP
jgi:RNA polymerase sigma factor (sigma-70 family)